MTTKSSGGDRRMGTVARRTHRLGRRYRSSVHALRTGSTRDGADPVTTARARAARETSATVRRGVRPRGARSTIAAGQTAPVLAVRDRSRAAIVRRVADRGTIVHPTVHATVHPTSVARREDQARSARSTTAALRTAGRRAARRHSTGGIAYRVAGPGTIVRRHAGRGTIARGTIARARTANGRRDTSRATDARSTAAVPPGEMVPVVTARMRIGRAPPDARRRAPARPVPQGRIASVRRPARQVSAIGRVQGSGRSVSSLATGTTGLAARALARQDAWIVAEPAARSAHVRHLRASGGRTHRHARKDLLPNPVVLLAPVRSLRQSQDEARIS